MNAEEKMAHAELLKDYIPWQTFVKDMKDLKELKASEMTSAYSNDRANAGAFMAGFRLALETAIEYPERTIKRNKSVIRRLADALTGKGE